MKFFDPEYLKKEQDKKFIESMLNVSKFNGEHQNREVNKHSGLRHVCTIPLEAVMPGIHPESAKYFNVEADAHERTKDINAWIKRFGDSLGIKR